MQIQERFSDGESCSFVAVPERVIFYDAESVCRGQFGNGRIASITPG